MKANIKNIRRERLGQLINERFSGKQADLATHAGIPANLISRYMTGLKGIGEDMARKIESACRLAPHWLDKKGSHANVEPGPELQGRVPLISWVQAGTWQLITDSFSPGDADEWLSCPVAHGPRTFVLRVRGESMFNPHGRPSFQEGDLIFVDPDEQSKNGSLVVVRLDNEKEATFKKLVIEGDKKYLRALNPAWPEPIIHVDDDATICGVVIFRGEKL